MKSSLVTGVDGQYRHRVVTENLVRFRKPDAPAVVSSPWVLYAMETASYEAIRPHLDAGEVSVGVGFQFEHLAATPAGDTLVARATITAVEGNKIILKFAQAGTGLVARGDQRLKGFAIAGKDGKFVWADARIKGDTVIVWSDRVRRPAVVRYAWADNPVGNLYNNAGLPAAPFQTGP